jgi:hypothetical protein
VRLFQDNDNAPICQSKNSSLHLYRYVFGLKGDVNGNIFYVDETNVLYPAGSNSVIYNIESKTQKFLPSSEKSEGITAMAVSATRKFAAIAERGDKAACIIYDIHTLRKRKVISLPDSDVKVGTFFNLIRLEIEMLMLFKMTRNSLQLDSPQMGNSF